MIPLLPAIAQRLQNFIKDMEPAEKVFKLLALRRQLLPKSMRENLKL